MKYPIIILALFGLSFTFNPEGNATVQSKRGIDVYFYSTPTRPYTVLKTGYFMNMGGGCDVDNGIQRAIDKKGQAVIITPDKNQYEVIVYN